MKKDVIAEMFRRFAKIEPEPKGELEAVNPFTLLVAVVLSAQATDASVNKATKPLFAAADTPAKMAALGEERLAEAIKTIGLYRSKARHVIAVAIVPEPVKSPIIKILVGFPLLSYAYVVLTPRLSTC